MTMLLRFSELYARIGRSSSSIGMSSMFGGRAATPVGGTGATAAMPTVTNGRNWLTRISAERLSADDLSRHLQAADHYRRAVAIEDRISYMEPPWWYFPVNQSLGAALYRAGRYDEARQAFTAALSDFPNNGWALYGLAASEQKLGRRAQAAAATAALNRAWMGDPKWLRMERL